MDFTVDVSIELKEGPDGAQFTLFPTDTYEFAEQPAFEGGGKVVRVAAGATNFQVATDVSAIKRLFFRSDTALTAKIVCAGSNLGATESTNVVLDFPYTLADSLGYEALYFSNPGATDARVIVLALGDDM